MDQVRPTRRESSDGDTYSAFEALMYTETACHSLIKLILDGKLQATFVGPSGCIADRLNICQYEFHGPEDMVAEDARAD